MASLEKAFAQSLIDTVLPTFGNQRVHAPVWDNGQKMFICDEYESESGNRYYRGVRFCDRVVIVEKVGLYHNWTYIDAIELFAFNGTKLELIQKQDYQMVFRDEAFIRKESEIMIKNYLNGVFKLQSIYISDEELTSQVKTLVDRCYKSILDRDYNTRLTQIIPIIEKQ